MTTDEASRSSIRSFFAGVRELMSLPKPFLEAASEEAFLAYCAGRFSLIRQGGILLTLFVWVVFLALDLLLQQIDPGFAEAGTTLTLYRLAVLPILGIFVAVGRSARFAQEELFANRAVLAVGLVMLMHETLLLAVAPFPYDFLHYFQGVMLLLLFGFGMFRLGARDVFYFLLPACGLLLFVIWGRWVLSYSNSLMAYVAYSWIAFSSLLVVIIALVGSTIGLQLERSVRRSYADQMLLRENNAQLEQQQHEILEARQRAEAATRSKSEFLANMSHEIRTPMNAVLGFCSLLVRTELSSVQRDYVNKTNGASRVLLGMIDQILDFSKVEAGKIVLEAIPFELDDVLQKYLAILGQAAQAKGLALSINVDADVPRYLVGDPLRLTQILINYGNNAIKFTEEGRVDLHVGLIGESATHFDVRMTVQDTGIGLSPEQISLLFQSFSQADGAVTRKYGGTGLGLAISKRLAELMGGEVGVESEANKGARFWFSAHLGKCSPEQWPDKPELAGEGRQVLSAEELAPLNGIDVLLVEDDALSLQVLSELLTIAGIRVTTAENGASALKLLASASFDLILMDIQMPVMDGITATAEIHRLLPACAPPVIGVSANALDADRERCIQVGMDDFVIKPIEYNALLRTMLRCLAAEHSLIG